MNMCCMFFSLQTLNLAGSDSRTICFYFFCHYIALLRYCLTSYNVARLHSINVWIGFDFDNFMFRSVRLHVQLPPGAHFLRNQRAPSSLRSSPLSLVQGRSLHVYAVCMYVMLHHNIKSWYINVYHIVHIIHYTMYTV